MNQTQKAFGKVNVQKVVKCDYCGNDSEFVRGDKIYPHRPDLFTKGFYRCDPCNAYVGCHPNTSNPLGRLANYALRAAKSKAHAAFDPMWKIDGYTRTVAYEWLAKNLGLTRDECHIGMFDVETCKRVVDLRSTFTR